MKSKQQPLKSKQPLQFPNYANIDIEYWKNLASNYNDNILDLQNQIANMEDEHKLALQELEDDLNYEKELSAQAENDIEELKRRLEFFTADKNELTEDCLKILNGYQAYPSVEQEVKNILTRIINLDTPDFEL